MNTYDRLTEEKRQELIDAEATIDTLIECTAITYTKAYTGLREALNKLQSELEAAGVKGKWRTW